jgi:hypothetical protein
LIPFWKQAKYQVPHELNKRQKAIANAALAQCEAILKRIDMEDNETLKARPYKPEEIRLLEDIIKEGKTLNDEILSYPKVKAAPDYEAFRKGFLARFHKVEEDVEILKRGLK